MFGVEIVHGRSKRIASQSARNTAQRQESILNATHYGLVRLGKTQLAILPIRLSERGMKQKSTPSLTGNSDVERRQLSKVVGEHIARLMTLRTNDVLLDLPFKLPLTDSPLQRTPPRVLELGWIFIDEEFEYGIRLELRIILKQRLDLGPELVERCRSSGMLARLLGRWSDVLVDILSNRF